MMRISVNSMSNQTYRVCFCFRRRFRLAAAETPSDTKEIFYQYSENGMMSVNQMRRFFIEVQGERNASVEEAQGILDGLHELKHLHLFHRRGINLEVFFKYLLGDDNPPLDPKLEGYGKSLWLMHGMFRANRGCGYVKKQDFLLSGPNSEVFNPKANLPVKTTLRETVYMGAGWYYDFSHTHFDGYSPPDFYARVGIAGVPADTVMKKTKTLEDNWIPTWDELFEFPFTVPELALLQINVCESDTSGKGKFAGQTCLPVWELREGIRGVPLHSPKGLKYKSVKLLMRFEFV